MNAGTRECAEIAGPIMCVISSLYQLGYWDPIADSGYAGDRLESQ